MQGALEARAQATLVADAIRAMAPLTRKGLEDYFRGLRNRTANGIMAFLDGAPLDYSKPKAEDCFVVARWLDSDGGRTKATNRAPVLLSRRVPVRHHRARTGQLSPPG